MALSVWEYIRQRTCDAVLAGCRDALEILERQDQGAAMWGAAKALRQQLHEAPRGNGHSNPGGNHASPQQSNHSPSGQPRPQSPPAALPAAAPADDRPASTTGQPTTAPQNSERRKVGRPRKEVFG